jgi:CrcB protein
VKSLSVLVGGAAGALCRWAIGLGLAGSPHTFPWATLTVNVSGAFGLGLFSVVVIELLPPTRYLRTLVGIGFFGAYTTFSTMAVEGVRLFDAGRPGLGLGYWAATLILGQTAGIYGIVLARAVARPTGRNQ